MGMGSSLLSRFITTPSMGSEQIRKGREMAQHLPKKAFCAGVFLAAILHSHSWSKAVTRQP